MFHLQVRWAAEVFDDTDGYRRGQKKIDMNARTLNLNLVYHLYATPIHEKRPVFPGQIMGGQNNMENV